MKPLVRGEAQTHKFHLPDGTSIANHCTMWRNDIYAVAVYDEEDGITKLAALELLEGRLTFALEAATRPNDAFVINVTEPDNSKWTNQMAFLKRIKG